MRSRTVVFIFKLNANDRAAVLPEKPVQLFGDFAVPDFDCLEIVRVI